jgi:hypothetical protein
VASEAFVESNVNCQEVEAQGDAACGDKKRLQGQPSCFDLIQVGRICLPANAQLGILLANLTSLTRPNLFLALETWLWKDQRLKTTMPSVPQFSPFLFLLPRKRCGPECHVGTVIPPLKPNRFSDVHKSKDQSSCCSPP